jgi:hypothetical protein
MRPRSSSLSAVSMFWNSALNVSRCFSINTCNTVHKSRVADSVADPGCFFRIPDPDFYPSRIPDLGSKNSTVPKEKDEKNFCYHTFFCSHKFHKIEYYVIFEMLKKKILANFQRIVEVFTQKIFNMLSNTWVWDPGSGKNLFRIPDPGDKKAPDPGSATMVADPDWIRIRNQDPDSESGSGFGIRIQEGKNDPQK